MTETNSQILSKQNNIPQKRGAAGSNPGSNIPILIFFDHIMFQEIYPCLDLVPRRASLAAPSSTISTFGIAKMCIHSKNHTSR